MGDHVPIYSLSSLIDVILLFGQVCRLPKKEHSCLAGITSHDLSIDGAEITFDRWRHMFEAEVLTEATVDMVML